MATNRKLKAALLKKLKITPQALSQRVNKIKDHHGPMSTEDATYVIAHMEGFDLSRYLDSNIVDHIRGLIPRSQKITAPTTTKKGKGSKKGSTPIKIGDDIPQVDALLSTTLVQDATRMAAIYPKYYVLENSIRTVIKRILDNKHGGVWWQLCVPTHVIGRVNKRKEKETNQPWHGKRGQHEIFYSDFSDLKDIIIKNWDDFKDIFPSQTWVTQKLEELEHPRNVMAHHNPMSKEDIQRIDLFFHDWIKILESKKNLIPQ